MAAITTTQAGNWTTGATWVGGVAPGDGDTAIIAHAVTVDDDVTVGTSPNATESDFAITINSGQTLTVASGKTLTSKGSIELTGSFVMSAGSTLILDSHDNGTAPCYRIGRLLDNNVTRNLICNGTSGNHCTIRGYSTTYRGCITTYHLGGTGAQFYWTDFSYLGKSGSARPSVTVMNDSATASLVLNDCTFNDIYWGTESQYNWKVGVNSAHLDIQRVTCSDSTGDSFWISGSTAPTGTRTVYDVVADIVVYIPLYNGDVQRCYFHDRFYTFTTASRGTLEFIDCFVRVSSSGGGSTSVVDVTDCYFFADDSDNPHHLNPNSTYNNVTVSGCVFDHIGATAMEDAGDLIMPGGGNTVFVQNCISLLRSTGGFHGVLLSLVGAITTDCQITHCTMGVADGPDARGISFCETGAQASDLISVCKSNLTWAPSANGGYKAMRIGNEATLDVITQENADYNVGWNLSAGSETRGYDNGPNAADLWTEGGADDAGVDGNGIALDGDPQFEDETRNLAKWSAYKGEAETAAAGLTLLQGDTSLIADLVTWVKAGFVVHNSDLENAGHDLVTIGAMGYESSGNRRRRFLMGASA